MERRHTITSRNLILKLSDPSIRSDRTESEFSDSIKSVCPGNANLSDIGAVVVTPPRKSLLRTQKDLIRQISLHRRWGTKTQMIRGPGPDFFSNSWSRDSESRREELKTSGAKFGNFGPVDFCTWRTALLHCYIP